MEMVLVTNNWRLWLVGLGASLVIFAVVFFTVIQPSQNTANQALTTGLQQSQQALGQAQKQLSTASSQAGAAAPQTQQALSKSSQLTGCLSQAGTDLGKVQACQAKFAH
jgi:type II secretory pathway component PulM